MKIIGIALFSIIFMSSCAGLGGGGSRDSDGRHISIECMIMDMNGKVLKKFGGLRCIFFPDGSLVAGSHERLAMIGPDGAIKWSRPIDTHHNMNLNSDGTKILVMSASLHRIKGRRIRFDKLVIYDLQGNERYSFDFFDHRSMLERYVPEERRGVVNPFDNGDSPRHVPEDVKFEYSHANTFFEISENDASTENPAFTKGNFVVNSLGQSIFVLDKDLRRVLWGHPADRKLHDIQLQKNGRFLVYRNDSPPEHGENFSTIEEFDPISLKTTIIYKADPPHSFSSRTGGGVQWLKNGNLLISDNTETDGGKVVELDPEGKIVWSIPYPLINPRTGKPDLFQRARRLDLSEFLKNHNGL